MLRNGQVGLTRSVLLAVAAVVALSVPFDLLLGSGQTAAMWLARVLMVGSYLTAGLVLSRLSPKGRARSYLVLAAATSAAAALMCAGTGGTQAAAFSVVWALPLAMGMFFQNHVRVSLASGLSALIAGGLLIWLDGRDLGYGLRWGAVTVGTTAIAALSCFLHKRLRRAELAWERAHEAQLAESLRALPVAVTVRSADGRVLFENTMARKLPFDLREACADPDQLEPGAAVLRRGTDERYPLEELPFRRALAGEAVSASDLELRTARGDRIPIEAHAAPLHGEAGEVQRVVVAYSDLRAREALQASLAQSDRLSSLGVLAAGMVHEIRNPLAFISSNVAYVRGELQRLASGHSAAPMEELLSALADSAEGVTRINRIVEDVRTFSRAQPEAIGCCDVSLPLEMAVKLATPSVKGRARLVREASAAPLVRGSDQRLTQVFLNLLMNAAQALPPDRPAQNEIRLRVAAAGAEVRVEVSDNGPGMPPEVMTHLFDPFFTTKPPGLGTGLGLSVCHGIVEKLGGRIEVRSRLGEGASFTVVLPVAEASQPRPHAAA